MVSWKLQLLHITLWTFKPHKTDLSCDFESYLNLCQQTFNNCHDNSTDLTSVYNLVTLSGKNCITTQPSRGTCPETTDISQSPDNKLRLGWCNMATWCMTIVWCHNKMPEVHWVISWQQFQELGQRKGSNFRKGSLLNYPGEHLKPFIQHFKKEKRKANQNN